MGVVTPESVFKNSGDSAERTQMRFYPTEHFGISDMLGRSSPTATYIKSQTFVFNTIKDVYRNTARYAFNSSLSLRYLGDPFFRIGVVTSNGPCFPYYKTELSNFFRFRSFLEDFLLSPSRLEFLLGVVKQKFVGDGRELFRNLTSNFNLKVRNSVFNLFPRVYYFRWLSYFLSFFLTRTSLNLRFKHVLVPEHWYNLMSMYRYKRKPSRSRAGLHFSRLGTGQIHYNTDYTYKRGILEFIFNSSLYPVNSRFKNYYYLNGFTRFSILESFDIINLIVEPFFMRPVKFYVNRVRERIQDSQKLDFREPLKIFEIRRLIRKSGDGMEPFLGVDYFMRISNISFVNDLGSAVHDDGFGRDMVYDLYTKSLPMFLDLSNISSMSALRSSNLLLGRSVDVVSSMDSNWAILRSIVKSNPSFTIYLKNLTYNKGSSEFYEWFRERHASKPLFQLYDLSLDLFLKSPLFGEILECPVSLSTTDLVGSELTVFENYRGAVSRANLKFLLSVRNDLLKRPFIKHSGILVFNLNKLKRSSVIRALPIPPLRKKVSFSFKRTPPLNLDRFSPYTVLKFANFELFEKRLERSRLRVLLRDPFLFFNRGSKSGKFRLFRRFLWSNIFLKPALAVSMRTSFDSGIRDLSHNLSNFLLKELAPWLRDEYNLSTAYINYIFSDLTIFYSYMLFSHKGSGYLANCAPHHRAELTAWGNLSKNQFDVKLWKSYLVLIFSNDHFYSFSSYSKEGSLKCGLLSLMLDGKRSIDFLLGIKNNYILKFPTKYLSFVATHSSEGSMNFGRGTWKLIVSTLNALVYLLLKSVLRGDALGCNKSFNNFFVLLEQLEKDLKAYNFIAKHLFLILDPLYSFRRMPGIVPDSNGSILTSMNRARGVDWWEGIPNHTSFKAIARVLRQTYPCDDVLTNKHRLITHMTGFWDSSSKQKFIGNLRGLLLEELPVGLLITIFRSSVTRASAISIIVGSFLSKRSADLACLVLLNEFKALEAESPAFTQKFNDGAWKLDSFYGVRSLSNFFFSSKVENSSYTESYFQDSRLFYNKDLQSSLATHRTPISFRPRVGAVRISHLFSLDSFNNTSRSDWYYSLFMQKPHFYHERSSLNILSDGSYIFLNGPTTNIKFYKLPFFYFLMYWFIKQSSLLFSVTAKYFAKRYFSSYYKYDPLNS
jgi:hypothetical protein